MNARSVVYGIKRIFVRKIKKVLLVFVISSVTIHLFLSKTHGNDHSISLAREKSPTSSHATHISHYAKTIVKNISKQILAKHTASETLSRMVFDAPLSQCKHGFFKVKEMNNCRPWLNCSEISQIVNNTLTNEEEYKKRKLGEGLHKKVYRVPWINPSTNKSTEFALSMSSMNSASLKLALIGGRNLKDLQPSNRVIKMTGYCEIEKKVLILTEHCGKYGTLAKMVTSRKYLSVAALHRFQIAIQVVQDLVYLHYESGKSKVHCDLHGTLQSLHQFLVTDDMNVVLNDVDEIPVSDQKNNMSAVCSPACLPNNEFLAPEQRLTDEECKKGGFKYVRKSNVKSDVWKIPNMTDTILSYNLRNSSKLANDVDLLTKRLIPIHKQCKIENIDQRADSMWVLQEYMKIYNEMISTAQ